MATWRSLINKSFQQIGVIQAGDDISSTSMETDAFERLIQMIANWSNDKDMVNAWYHQTFSLTSGTPTYTLSVGGTLNATATPVRVTGWASVSGNFRNGGVPISHDEFAATFKDPIGTRSDLAAFVAIDNAVPMNVRIGPTPGSSPGSLILDYWAALTPPATITDTVAYAGGYEEAIYSNLAVILYPNYARPSGLDPVVAALAVATKAMIQQRNRVINGPGAPAAPSQVA